MTATREHRNAGKIEDAVAVIGMAVVVTEHLWGALGPFLPDDFPMIADELEAVRVAHVELQRRVVDGEQPSEPVEPVDEADELVAEWERLRPAIEVDANETIPPVPLREGVKLARRVVHYAGDDPRVARIRTLLREAGFPS